MKLKPLSDRVVVKRVEPEKKTAGGIILPESAAEKSVEAKVLAVGPGKPDSGGGFLHTLQVSVGDTVLLNKFGGVEVKVDGEDLLILREDEILAIVEG
jgi:chaperonin GroES